MKTYTCLTTMTVALMMLFTHSADVLAQSDHPSRSTGGREMVVGSRGKYEIRSSSRDRYTNRQNDYRDYRDESRYESNDYRSRDNYRAEVPYRDDYYNRDSYYGRDADYGYNGYYSRDGYYGRDYNPARTDDYRWNRHGYLNGWEGRVRRFDDGRWGYFRDGAWLYYDRFYEPTYYYAHPITLFHSHCLSPRGRRVVGAVAGTVALATLISALIR